MAYHLPIASADELTSDNAALAARAARGAQGTVRNSCASATGRALLAVGAVDAGDEPRQALNSAVPPD